MKSLRYTALALLAAMPAVAQAQAIKTEPPMKTFTAAQVEAVEMPSLA
jgi:hypothetical protein